ncbi:MAG: hypothetical protein FJ013_06475 [Chloroflexi bacterium]|nr:hypothetical protein [Chloroflexota bacterium]MBM4452508.1 hypothetical protein [Chloroflexota bacterium]MBM4454209.1 hypothetical protein [Chloroflexota bacterium]
MEYLFIDESGDPGHPSGSKYYAEVALQISGDHFSCLVHHSVAWRYIRRLTSEMKRLPRGHEMKPFLEPLSELQQTGAIKCSCVYLTKDNYTGPYLKSDSPRGVNPVLFRNFVHRQLLEFHFSRYTQKYQNIELVFDRFEMTGEAIANLASYLRGNLRLPNLKHITHADSLYVDALQIVSQLVTVVKDVVLEQSDAAQLKLIEFIPMRDITRVPREW